MGRVLGRGRKLAAGLITILRTAFGAAARPTFVGLALVVAASAAAAPAPAKLAALHKKYDATRGAEDSTAAHDAARDLAYGLESAGDWAGAQTVFLGEVAIAEKHHGPNSREVLGTLAAVLDGFYLQNRWSDAEHYIERGVAIAKQQFGEHSEEYYDWLTRYSTILASQYEVAAAIRIGEQALVLAEELAKARHDDMSLRAELASVAYLYWRANQPDKAVALYNRRFQLMASDPPDRQAGEVYSAALIYKAGGRDDLAAPLFAKAIALYEQAIAAADPKNPMLAVDYTGLAATYDWMSDLPNAEAAARKAYELSPQLASGELAKVLMRKNKLAEALALYQRSAQTMSGTALLAHAFDEPVGMVLRRLGRYGEATRVFTTYRDWLATTWTTRDQRYPDAVRDVASVAIARGDFAAADPLIAESLDVSERELANKLAIGTESDHQGALQHGTYELNEVLAYSALAGAKDPRAARLGLETVLRRKGRALDATAASLAALRTKLAPEDQKLLDDLAAARAQLAKVSVAGPGANPDQYKQSIAALEEQIAKLEVALAQKSAQYKAASQPVTLAAVQKLVPKGARLVEIASFAPIDPMRWTDATADPAPRRYLAFVLGPSGDPAVIDLGQAQPIDDAVKAFRKSVSNPKSTDVGEKGHALYAATLGKLEHALGGATEILIAPDGALNLVPFAALTDDTGKLLVERENFTYLTSGRDLLRLTVKTKAQGGGVLFANPAFDATGGPPASHGDGGTRGVRSIDLASLMWPALPGTAQEADLVEHTWPHFTDFRGDRATEGQLKAIHAPQILHLATHGFFLPDKTATSIDSPLLRSGLALAGANKLKSGGDDGILTSLEASSLDLWGTELVVLSACDTGNGKATNGDGVYGLRRALVIAGAQSLVMSLWQVDDAATRDLMAGYYAKLAAGQARGSALREVQLELRKNPAYAHPFYWAAFFAAGANAPL